VRQPKGTNNEATRIKNKFGHYSSTRTLKQFIHDYQHHQVTDNQLTNNLNTKN
jgi:hypothetical protein